MPMRIPLQTRLRVKSFLRDETGATAIEYGLILSLMTLACIGAMIALGGGSDGMWSRITTKAGGALK